MEKTVKIRVSSEMNAEVKYLAERLGLPARVVYVLLCEEMFATHTREQLLGDLAVLAGVPVPASGAVLVDDVPF